MRIAEDFYWRKMPHIDRPGSSYFVTFRLHGSIPFAVLVKLKKAYWADIERYEKVDNVHLKRIKKFKRRKLYLIQFDALLDQIRTGPMHLSIPDVTNILAKQLHRFDGELYDLQAFSIMSNHAHVLFDSYLEPKTLLINPDPFLGCITLNKIMKRIKGPAAMYSNRKLGLSGKFWAEENFDIYIRNKKMYNNVIDYIVNNPVKAGLVENWYDFSGNYLKGYSK